MPNKDEYYADGDKLDPAEVIGPPRMLIEDLDGILRRIENTGPAISPKDCVALFCSVWRIRFTDWDRVEILWTPERRRKVLEAGRELYSRFQAQMDLHSGPLLEKLEAGIRDLVEEVSAGLKNHEEIRRTYPEPWDYNTSYEFLGDVIFPLDTLGWVLELMRHLRIETSEGTTASVEHLDRTLRLSLPEIAEEFRKAGDSIDPVRPDLFPESFWWTRLPGAKPIE